MKCGLICVETIFFMLFSIFGWNHPRDSIHSCPRIQSKLVRKVVEKKIKPILDRYRVDMPIECPFHPDRDVLWWPDSSDVQSNQIASRFQSKIAKGSADLMLSEYSLFHDFMGNFWRCPICGKDLLCADRLSGHFDAEHSSYIYWSSNQVCLADYCDILRCHVLVPRTRLSMFGNSGTRLLGGQLLEAFPWALSDHKNCNETAMIKMEKKCHAVVRQCIVPLVMMSKISIKDFYEMEEAVLKEVCSYLNCQKFWESGSIEDPSASVWLLLLIAVVLAAGFCISNYIVWIFFGSILRRPALGRTDRRVVAASCSQNHFSQMKMTSASPSGDSETSVSMHSEYSEYSRPIKEIRRPHHLELYGNATTSTSVAASGEVSRSLSRQSMMATKHRNPRESNYYSKSRGSPTSSKSSYSLRSQYNQPISRLISPSSLDQRQYYHTAQSAQSAYSQSYIYTMPQSLPSVMHNPYRKADDPSCTGRMMWPSSPIPESRKSIASLDKHSRARPSRQSQKQLTSSTSACQQRYGHEDDHL